MPPDTGQALHIDAQVSLRQLDPQMLGHLGRLAPFGQSNPEPMLCAHGLEVASCRVVGENHLKMELTQEGARLPAIAFNCQEPWIQKGTSLSAAFIPRISTFRGPHLELVIKDLRPSA